MIQSISDPILCALIKRGNEQAYEPLSDYQRNPGDGVLIADHRKPALAPVIPREPARYWVILKP